MGDTNISWADKTWNPWQGCTQLTAGCDHCYMFTAKARYGQDPETVVRSKTVFDAPLRWCEPQRVFVCSWSDFFHKAADPWRTEAWEIMRHTKRHTYQLLTKRHGRIAHCLPHGWPEDFQHVQLGVSVEDQRRADERIPVLLDTPAAVRFLSVEPLLGWTSIYEYLRTAGIGWVICGGESGPGYRPMELNWLRNIRDECSQANVPLFVKQDSGARPGKQGRIPDDLWALKQFPKTLEVTA